MYSHAKKQKPSVLRRKEKRAALKQQGVITEDGMLKATGFSMYKVDPMTHNQKLAFQYWDEGYHLMLHGIAGTGKTFLGLYFAIDEILKKNSEYKKIYIIRSTVSTRPQGFMPGGPKDKIKVYEGPYVSICKKLFGRGDAYDVLKQRNQIEFLSTSFLRGETFEDCIVIVDEVQNMSEQELHTVMTRLGENSRVVFCGDVKQDDLTSKRYNEESGLRDFMRIINNMMEFEFIEFEIDDIVRSALVKSYIIERDKLGL